MSGALPEKLIEDAPKDGSVIVVNGWPAYWFPGGTSWNASCSSLIKIGVWVVLDEHDQDDGWFQPDEVSTWRPMAEGETAASVIQARLRKTAG